MAEEFFEIIIPSGATASALAKKYGTDLDTIKRLNPQIKDIDKIYAGDKMKLPKFEVPKIPEVPKLPKNYSLDLETYLKKLYSGGYTFAPFARERMGEDLQKLYPSMDVWKDVYTRAPDGWEKEAYWKLVIPTPKLPKIIKTSTWKEVDFSVTRDIAKPVYKQAKKVALDIITKVKETPVVSDIIKKTKDITRAYVMKPITTKFPKQTERLGQLPDFVEKAISTPEPGPLTPIIKKISREYLGPAIDNYTRQIKKDWERDRPLREEFIKDWLKLVKKIPWIGRKITKSSQEKELQDLMVKKGIRALEEKKEPEDLPLDESVISGYIGKLRDDLLEFVTKAKDSGHILRVDESGYVYQDEEATNIARKRIFGEVSDLLEEHFPASDPVYNEAIYKAQEAGEARQTLVNLLTVNFNTLYYSLTTPDAQKTESLRELSKSLNKILEVSSALEGIDPTLESLNKELEKHNRSVANIEKYYDENISKWWDELENILGAKAASYLQKSKELINEEIDNLNKIIADLPETKVNRVFELLGFIDHSQTFWNIQNNLNVLLEDPKIADTLRKLFLGDKKVFSKELKALNTLVRNQDWYKENEKYLKEGFIGKVLDSRSVEDFEKLRKELETNPAISDPQLKAGLRIVEIFENDFKISDELFKLLQRQAKATKLFMDISRESALEKEKAWAGQVNTYLETKGYKVILGAFIPGGLTWRDSITGLKFAWESVKDKTIHVKFPYNFTKEYYNLWDGTKVEFWDWKEKSYEVSPSKAISKAWNSVEYMWDTFIFRGTVPAINSAMALLYQGYAHWGLLDEEVLKDWRLVQEEGGIKNMKDYKSWKLTAYADPALNVPDGSYLREEGSIQNIGKYLVEAWNYYRSPKAYDEFVPLKDTKIEWIDGKIKIGPWTYDTLNSPQELWAYNPHLKDVYIIPAGTRVSIPRFRNTARFTDLFTDDFRYQLYKEHPGFWYFFDEFLPFMMPDPSTIAIMAGKTIGLGMARTFKFDPNLGMKPLSQVKTLFFSTNLAYRSQRLDSFGREFIRLATFKGVDWKVFPKLLHYKPKINEWRGALADLTVLKSAPRVIQEMTYVWHTNFKRLMDQAFLTYQWEAILKGIAKEKKMPLKELNKLIQMAFFDPEKMQAPVVREVFQAMSLRIFDLQKWMGQRPFLDDALKALYQKVKSTDYLIRQQAFNLSYQKLGVWGKDFFDDVTVDYLLPLKQRRIKNVETYTYQFLRNVTPDSQIQAKTQIELAKKLLKSWDEDTKYAFRVAESAKIVVPLPSGTVLKIAPIEQRRNMRNAFEWIVENKKPTLVINPDKVTQREFEALWKLVGDTVDLRLTNFNKIPIANVYNVFPQTRYFKGSITEYFRVTRSIKTKKIISTVGIGSIDDVAKKIKQAKVGRTPAEAQELFGYYLQNWTPYVEKGVRKEFKYISSTKVGKTIKEKIALRTQMPRSRNVKDVIDHSAWTFLKREGDEYRDLVRYLQNISVPPKKIKTKIGITYEIKDIRDRISGDLTKALDRQFTKKTVTIYSDRKREISKRVLDIFEREAAVQDFFKQTIEGKSFLKRWKDFIPSITDDLLERNTTALKSVRTRIKRGKAAGKSELFIKELQKTEANIQDKIWTHKIQRYLLDNFRDKSTLDPTSYSLLLKDTLGKTETTKVLESMDEFVSFTRNQFNRTISDYWRAAGKKEKFITEVEKLDGIETFIKKIQKQYRLEPRKTSINTIVGKLDKYWPKVRIKDQIIRERVIPSARTLAIEKNKLALQKIGRGSKGDAAKVIDDFAKFEIKGDRGMFATTIGYKFSQQDRVNLLALAKDSSKRDTSIILYVFNETPVDKQIIKWIRSRPEMKSVRLIVYDPKTAFIKNIKEKTVPLQTMIDELLGTRDGKAVYDLANPIVRRKERVFTDQEFFDILSKLPTQISPTLKIPKGLSRKLPDGLYVYPDDWENFRILIAQKLLKKNPKLIENTLGLTPDKLMKQVYADFKEIPWADYVKMWQKWELDPKKLTQALGRTEADRFLEFLYHNSRSVLDQLKAQGLAVSFVKGEMKVKRIQSFKWGLSYTQEQAVRLVGPGGFVMGSPTSRIRDLLVKKTSPITKSIDDSLRSFGNFLRMDTFNNFDDWAKYIDDLERFLEKPKARVTILKNQLDILDDEIKLLTREKKSPQDLMELVRKKSELMGSVQKSLRAEGRNYQRWLIKMNKMDDALELERKLNGLRAIVIGPDGNPITGVAKEYYTAYLSTRSKFAKEGYAKLIKKNRKYTTRWNNLRLNDELIKAASQESKRVPFISKQLSEKAKIRNMFEAELGVLEKKITGAERKMDDLLKIVGNKIFKPTSAQINFKGILKANLVPDDILGEVNRRMISVKKSLKSIEGQIAKTIKLKESTFSLQKVKVTLAKEIDDLGSLKKLLPDLKKYELAKVKILPRELWDLVHGHPSATFLKKKTQMEKALLRKFSSVTGVKVPLSKENESILRAFKNVQATVKKRAFLDTASRGKLYDDFLSKTADPGYIKPGAKAVRVPYSRLDITKKIDDLQEARIQTIIVTQRVNNLGPYVAGRPIRVLHIPELSTSQVPQLAELGGFMTDIEYKGFQKVWKAMLQDKSLIFWDSDFTRATEVANKLKQILKVESPLRYHSMQVGSDLFFSVIKKREIAKGKPWRFARGRKEYLKVWGDPKGQAIITTKALEPKKIMHHVYKRHDIEKGYLDLVARLDKSSLTPAKLYIPGSIANPKKYILGHIQERIPTFVLAPEVKTIRISYLRNVAKAHKEQYAQLIFPKNPTSGERIIMEYLKSKGVTYSQAKVALKRELFLNPSLIYGKNVNWNYSISKEFPTWLFPYGTKFDPKRQAAFDAAFISKRIFKSKARLHQELKSTFLRDVNDWLSDGRIYIPKFLQDERYALRADPRDLLARLSLTYNRETAKKSWFKLKKIQLDTAEEMEIRRLVEAGGRKILSDAEKLWIVKKENLIKSMLSKWNRKKPNIAQQEWVAKTRKMINDLVLSKKKYLTKNQLLVLEKNRRRWEDTLALVDVVFKWDRTPGFWEKIAQRQAEKLGLKYARAQNLYLLADFPLTGFEKIVNSTAYIKTLRATAHMLPQFWRAGLTVHGYMKSIWIKMILYWRIAWYLRNTYDDAIRGAMASHSVEYFFECQSAFGAASASFLRKFAKDIIDFPKFIFKPVKGEVKELANTIGGKIGKTVSRYWDDALSKARKTPYLPWDPKTANKIRKKGFWQSLEKKFWDKHLAPIMAWDEALEYGSYTPKGEWITKHTIDWICEAGMYQVTSDPVQLRKLISILDETTMWRRLKKRAFVLNADIEVFANFTENVRRQFLAHELLFKKAMSVTETKAKVWNYMFNYRDLSIVGKNFRYLFPFWAFNTKSFTLWTKTIAKGGPRYWLAARAFMDSWTEVTQSLPEWARGRIPIGNDVYWYPWISLAQVLEFWKDPWKQIKQFAENPHQVPLGLGWNPFWTNVINYQTEKRFFDISIDIKKQTGWTSEEIERFISDQKLKRDISGEPFWMEALFTYVPFARAMKSLFEVDMYSLTDGTSILKSRKLRELMKQFGLNILKWEDIDIMQKIYFDMPPRLRSLMEKEISKEDPAAWQAQKNYWGKTLWIKASRIAKKDPALGTYYLQLWGWNQIYWDMREKQGSAAAQRWLERHPDIRKELETMWSENKETIPWHMWQQREYNMGQLETLNRAMADRIYKKEIFDRAEILGLEIPFGIPGDKDEFLTLTLDAQGNPRFVNPEEWTTIVSREWVDKLINKTQMSWQEYIKDVARIRYHEWLMEEGREKLPENKAFDRKMKEWQLILPHNIDELPDKEADKYFTTYWKFFEHYFSDAQKSMYFTMLKGRHGEWFVEYRKKLKDYYDRWSVLIDKFREKDFNFFEEFYKEPEWFQKLYFLRYPTKEKWYPFARDWTKLLHSIEIEEKKTYGFQHEKRKEASDYFWDHEDIVKNYWDKDEPGFYQYMKDWQKITLISESNPEKYFELFFNQSPEFQKRFFDRNPKKKLYYPFIRHWVSLIQIDKENWEKKGIRTREAKDYFWSSAKKTQRQAYAKDKLIASDKTILDYLKVWDEIFIKTEDNVEDYFKLFYDQPDWFRKHFFFSNPEKKIYYRPVSEWLKRIASDKIAQKKTGINPGKAKEYYLKHIKGVKKVREAWDKENPGIINYLDTWGKIIKSTEENPEVYFKEFYKQSKDFQNRFFKNNPNKELYYPKVREWIEAIRIDKKNWEEKEKRTHIAQDFFNSFKNTKEGRAYGRDNPITETKNIIDYIELWQEVIKETEENPRAFFEVFDKQPDWFKNHYYFNHPLKKIYYSFARELAKLDSEAWAKEFWKPKYEIERKAWDEDKPGFLDYMRFWKKLSSLAETGSWELYFNYYYSSENRKNRERHERNHPGVDKKFKLYREYQEMPSITWEDRRARREFLKAHPLLIEWWAEDISVDEAKTREFVEKYFSFQDNIPVTGKGREYFIEVRKWQAAADKFLQDHPEVLLFLTRRPKQYIGEKAELLALAEEYRSLGTQIEKNTFLENHPELKEYFLNQNPPGIRDIIKIQQEYFRKTDEDKQAFLERHPELLEYWEAKILPWSYFFEPGIFRIWQETVNKIDRCYDKYLVGDWTIAETMREALPDRYENPGDTPEADWFRTVIYRMAMKTWIGLLEKHEFKSIYFFRQLPRWLRDMYYKKHPEKKDLSYESLSRFLEEPLRIWESTDPKLVWAFKMRTKYGKDMPFDVYRKVRKILVGRGVWEDRSKWTREQWNNYWIRETMKRNALRDRDLQNIPLLKKSLDEVKRIFPIRLPKPSFGKPRVGRIEPLF